MQNQNHNHIGILETETSQNPADACISGGETPEASPQAPPSDACMSDRGVPLERAPLSPANPSSARATGKIARLPADLRDSVNQWITDCVPFDTISQRLAEVGHPGITHQNISKWKLF